MLLKLVCIFKDVVCEISYHVLVLPSQGSIIFTPMDRTRRRLFAGFYRAVGIELTLSEAHICINTSPLKEDDSPPPYHYIKIISTTPVSNPRPLDYGSRALTPRLIGLIGRVI